MNIELNHNRRQFFASATIVALATFLWGRRLVASFWLDETLTVWIAQEDITEVLSRSYTYQGQSFLYFLIPWGLIHVGLIGEFWLRLPSFLCVVGALFFLYGVFRQFFSKFSSAVGLLALVASDGAMFMAVSARPYALAFLLTSAALYFAGEYLSTASRRALIAGSVLQGIAVSTNYFFIGNLCPVLLFSLFSKKQSLKNSVLLLCTFIGASFFSLAIHRNHLQSLLSHRAELSIDGSPSLFHLLFLFFNGSTLFLFLIPFLLALALQRSQNLGKQRSSRLILLSSLWYLIPVLSLYALATVSEASTIFSERYLLCHLASLPFLFAAFAEKLTNDWVRRIFLVLFVGFIVTADHLKEFPKEDWRGVARALDDVSEDDSILLYSGLIETRSPQFLVDVANVPYLTSSLRVYGISKSVSLIPFSLQDERLWESWQAILKERKRAGQKVYVVINDATLIQGMRASSYLTHALQSEGFLILSKESYGGIILLTVQCSHEN